MPKNDPEMSILDAGLDSQGAALYRQNLAYLIYNAWHQPVSADFGAHGNLKRATKSDFLA